MSRTLHVDVKGPAREADWVRTMRTPITLHCCGIASALLAHRRSTRSTVGICLAFLQLLFTGHMPFDLRFLVKEVTAGGEVSKRCLQREDTSARWPRPPTSLVGFPQFYRLAPLDIRRTTKAAVASSNPCNRAGMASYGEDWDRFSSRHLGEWHVRTLAISVSDGSLISATSVRLSSQPPTQSQTNPSSLLLLWAVECDDTSELTSSASEILLRYNLDKLHVFADGSYSADHTLLELAPLMPSVCAVAHHAIEFALPVSATERMRSFLLYDETRVLTAVLTLEEARAGLFDTREPLSLTSLVGEWRGQCETFRHEPEDERGSGFGPHGRKSPSRRARRAYDEKDLPPQLKNPSGGDDGVLKTKAAVRFGWDPAKGALRRSTVLSDMQDNELGRSVIYGSVDPDGGGLFDVARFENNTANESVFIALNNACFVMAPVKRIRGVAAAGELGCLITPSFRRRLMRIYGKSSVASETLASESLA